MKHNDIDIIILGYILLRASKHFSWEPLTGIPEQERGFGSYHLFRSGQFIQAYNNCREAFNLNRTTEDTLVQKSPFQKEVINSI